MCHVLNRPRCEGWSHHRHLSPNFSVIRCSIVNPVRDVTLFIQFIFGLPRALDLGVIPSMISFSRDTDFLNFDRPNYSSFFSF